MTIIIIICFIFIFLMIICNCFFSFHKIKRSIPLDDQQLLDGIKKLAIKLELDLDLTEIKILVEKLNTKVLSLQVGFNSCILISKNFLDKLSYNEKIAVMAHEMVHAKKKHNIKNLIGLVILFSISFVLFTYHSNIILLLFLSIFILCLVLIILTIRRKYEKEADLCAAKLTDSDSLIQALKKINELNNISENENSWLSTHPNLATRIKYLSDLNK